jgi:hypothetical protein
VDEIEQLQGMVKSFYQKLFSNNHVRRDWFQTEITYPMLERDSIAKLAEPFQVEEVKHAIFMMNPWKAPGQDGFPAGFYQKDWDIVGKSVCDFVCSTWDNPSGIATVN